MARPVNTFGVRIGVTTDMTAGDRGIDNSATGWPWWSLAALIEDVTAIDATMPLQPFRHALAVARELPAELAHRIYFEDRGGGWPRPMDFIVGVGKAGRTILSGDNPALSMPASLLCDPWWAGITSLAQRWSTPTDPLSGIKRIWLEFDAPEPRCAAPRSGAPGVFVDLPASEHPVRSVPLALDALECVAGHAFAKTSRDLLFHLAERLPSGASIAFAAVFPSRRHAGVRVCLTGVRPRQLVALRAEIDEPADISGLSNAVDRHWRDRFGVAPAVIHLDLGNSVRPAIGLEYHFDRGAQRSGRVVEWPFLWHLQTMGFLSTDTLARCARWPATTRTTLRYGISPSVLVRRVAHVKVVCQADSAVTAKVYFAAAATSIR